MSGQGARPPPPKPTSATTGSPNSSKPTPRPPLPVAGSTKPEQKGTAVGPSPSDTIEVLPQHDVSDSVMDLRVEHDQFVKEHARPVSLPQLKKIIPS